MKRSELFTIFYKDGWAWLTVTPPPPGGHMVYPEEILGRLKLLGIPPVRKQQLYTIIESAAGTPQRLVPWPEGEQHGPRITLTVSKDAMSAILTIDEGKSGGEPLSVAFLTKALKKAGVIFGIKEDNLQTAVENTLFGQPIVAAEGTYPVHQISSKPEYFFETDRGKPFKELSYNRMDLRELNFIQNKKKGELLARLSDPVHPADGQDVYGNVISAKTDSGAAALRGGKGTERSLDGNEIRAAVDGNVKLKGGTVIVEPLITVENVDYSNGNMDFNGAIDIRGRVADGFTIRAEGDIQIGKSVSRVHITSGGDMILKAGISGNDEGTLVCGGDLYARYIENAEVECRGNLYVEEAVMHSKIKADGDIILAGKRAEIFGGTVVAGGSIICKKLGNINEPFTELHVGMLPETYRALLHGEGEVKETASRLDELENKIRQLGNSLQKNKLDKETAVKISLAKAQLEQEYQALNDLYTVSIKHLHDVQRNLVLQRDAVLKVEQNIFGKVSVFFGMHKWVSSGKGNLKTTLTLKNGVIIEK